MTTRRTSTVLCPACDGLGLTRAASNLIGTAIGIPSYKAPALECSACRGTGRIRPAAERRSLGHLMTGLRGRFSLAG
ncbi:hypothetical protein [Georgenia sp. AZ-5]|uniref:hypothetical protein n=1 Tax=Georgenia sp. AZ-5 TaxID=3367526 RepID=UPI0037550994